jgi:hypothetical protein
MLWRILLTLVREDSAFCPFMTVLLAVLAALGALGGGKWPALIALIALTPAAAPFRAANDRLGDYRKCRKYRKFTSARAAEENHEQAI